jgi:uncharacterized protein with beta-barrel porin domain
LVDVRLTAPATVRRLVHVFAVALPILWLCSGAAFAQSGGAGSNGFGGAGGASSATGFGGNGGVGSGQEGGGGGGAGAPIAGSGGHGAGPGAGTGGGFGVGGVGQGGAGGNGGGGTIDGSSGGGGGAGGQGSIGVSGSITGAFNGGSGGNGGHGLSATSTFGGGGGGAGGYGVVTTGATTYVSGLIRGGPGGAGGDGSVGGGRGGNGGDSGVGVAAGANFTNAGTIMSGMAGTGGNSTLLGNGAGGNGSAGLATTVNGLTITNTGTILGGGGGPAGRGAGAASPVGAGGVGIAASSAVIINSGTISGGDEGLIIANNTANVGGAGITGSGLTIQNSGTISGGLGGGRVTRANAITFTGGSNFLQLQAGSTINGNIAVGTGASVTFNQLIDRALGNIIAGGGSVIDNAAGTILTFSGANTYTGGTTVSAGTLNVTGSIGSSSLVTVASAATLTGVGTVGNLSVASGGTFTPGSGTPGTSMTVNGTLSFAVGANYQVYLNPTTSSTATATGTASLNGTVLANFAAGTYLTKAYTILTSAGLGSTTFSALSTTNLPAGFSASLSYSSTNVFLNLVAALTPQIAGGGSFSPNQQGVANALNNYFNTVGSIPSSFNIVFGLTGSNLSTALSQLAGETMTGSRIAGMSLTSQFLGHMLEPHGNSGAPQSASLASESDPLCACDVEPSRWTAWGSGYGGGAYTSGNSATGTSSVTSTTYGFAGGMDYDLTSKALVGVALSAGGLNWSVGNGLGSGNATSLGLGVYGIAHEGAGYLAAGAAFANHDTITNRTAVGDHVQARFNAQSYGVRGEGGWRLAVAPQTGITPYGAAQFQLFHTPAYGETDITAAGGGFALSYGASDATDTRTEVGARFDSELAIAGKLLVLRARLGWSHDFISNPGVAAAFQQLPGSNFIVSGTTPASDSALTSFGAEYAVAPGTTLLARFDGEFSGTSQSYAGTAAVRFRW